MEKLLKEWKPAALISFCFTVFTVWMKGASELYSFVNFFFLSIIIVFCSVWFLYVDKKNPEKSAILNLDGKFFDKPMPSSSKQFCVIMTVIFSVYIVWFVIDYARAEPIRGMLDVHADNYRFDMSNIEILPANGQKPSEYWDSILFNRRSDKPFDDINGHSISGLLRVNRYSSDVEIRDVIVTISKRDNLPDLQYIEPEGAGAGANMLTYTFDLPGNVKYPCEIHPYSFNYDGKGGKWVNEPFPLDPAKTYGIACVFDTKNSGIYSIEKIEVKVTKDLYVTTRYAIFSPAMNAKPYRLAFCSSGMEEFVKISHFVKVVNVVDGKMVEKNVRKTYVKKRGDADTILDNKNMFPNEVIVPPRTEPKSGK